MNKRRPHNLTSMPIPNGKPTPPPSVVSPSPADTPAPVDRDKAIEELSAVMYLVLFEKFRDEIESVQRAQVHLYYAKERLTRHSAEDKHTAFLDGLTVDGATQHYRFCAEKLGAVIVDWLETRTPAGEPKS